MVDIHSHILFGLDDGSRNFDESMAMLRMAAEHGTTDIVATPHANERYSYDPGTIADRIAELSAVCLGVPRIHRGCDFHLSYKNLEDALRNPAKYTVNGGAYLLVEFSDQFISPTTNQIFTELFGRGITPIITHPERNPHLRSRIEDLRSWVASGCLLQVTAQSLSGLFGKSAENSAWAMLDSGLVHFIASDSHNTAGRNPRLDTARALIENRLGAEWAEALFLLNPRAVILNQPIEPQDLVSKKPVKKWYNFWSD